MGQRPLWVKSRHVQCTSACPLCANSGHRTRAGEYAEGEAMTTRSTKTANWLDVLSASLRLGLTSFGGPIAHLGYFRDEYVVRRKWLDEKTYADLVALCQFLPGRPAARSASRSASCKRATPEHWRRGPGSRCRRPSRWCCLPMASTRSETRSAAAGCMG